MLLIVCMTDSWSFESGISLKRILLQGMDKEKFGRRHGGYPVKTSPSRHGEDLSAVDLFTRYVPGGSRSKVEVRYKVEIAANRTRIWLENGVVRCLRAPRMRAIGAYVTILVAGGVVAPFNTFHSPLTCSPSTTSIPPQWPLYSSQRTTRTVINFYFHFSPPSIRGTTRTVWSNVIFTSLPIYYIRKNPTCWSANISWDKCQ